jgi:hypothetical protein
MRNTRSSADRHLGLLLLALAFAGCETQIAGSGVPQSGSLMSLASALQGAVAECASTAQSCDLTSPDGGAKSDGCRAEFASCREAAKAAAGPDIDKAVNPCIDAFKGCHDGVDAGDAKAACSDTLHACLGDRAADAGKESGKPADDAASDPHVSTSPVVACIEALHTCSEGDEPAQSCTSALRDCIASTVGHNGGSDPDGGKPDHADGGKPVEPDADGDAGKPEKPDQPADKPDADRPLPEPHADADVPANDAGQDGDSKACKDAHEACLSAGGDRDGCARALKACREN